MPYLITAAFLAGAASATCMIAYKEWRRHQRFKAWESVIDGDAGKPMRLSEVLRRQGVYDDPEMFV